MKLLGKSKRKRQAPAWTKKKSSLKSGCKSVRGRKAKGRAACVAVHALLMDALPFLNSDDIYVKTGSAGGVDIHLSERAQQKFPFDIEVKAKENLNIWAALAQATANTKGNTPIVFFKRNRTPMFVAMLATDFMKWVS